MGLANNESASKIFTAIVAQMIVLNLMLGLLSLILQCTLYKQLHLSQCHISHESVEYYGYFAAKTISLIK